MTAHRGLDIEHVKGSGRLSNRSIDLHTLRPQAMEHA
jgi:hypothetical protein